MNLLSNIQIYSKRLSDWLQVWQTVEKENKKNNEKLCQQIQRRCNCVNPKFGGFFNLHINDVVQYGHRWENMFLLWPNKQICSSRMKWIHQPLCLDNKMSKYAYDCACVQMKVCGKHSIMGWTTLVSSWVSPLSSCLCPDCLASPPHTVQPSPPLGPSVGLLPLL